MSAEEAAARSLATRAAGGAAWTIATGIGARVVGLGGTLAITYFVSRSDLGEVSDAAIAVALANQFSTLGVGPYYVARPEAGRDVAWHATVVHLVLGGAALSIVLLLGPSLGAWMNAPHLAHYLPLLALGGLFERATYMPERVLARSMRFRAIGLCRAAGELAYTAVSIALAVLGARAMAIVAGNLVRSSVRFAILACVVPRAEWLSPSRLSADTMRPMLRFGAPMSVSNAAGFASRRLDNAIVSSLFGAGVVGAYNLAYNVADAPAVQVGEQIGDVMLPSFARMDPRRRPAALLRATGLLALVTFPLAVGLGVIAPTLVDTLLAPQWRDVAPMLALLSALGVARPIGWTLSAYLLARDRPRVDAILEVGKLAAVVVLLATVGRAGPLWACTAVGVAFALHAIASMAVVQALDGIRASALAKECAAPLVACIPMAAAVIGVRALVHARGLGLACEIGAGAVAYVFAARWFAKTTASDLVALARQALPSGEPFGPSAGCAGPQRAASRHAPSASGSPIATSPGTTSSRMPS